MRIAYVAYWDLAAADGVAKKIAAQVEHWRRAGHDVETFEIRPGRLLDRARRTRAALGEVTDFAPDAIYVRYDLFLPPAGKLARMAPLAVELNGDDRAEMRRRDVGARIVNEWSRRAVLHRAAGIVCVTNELASRAAPLGVRTAVIANGADPTRIPWSPPPRNERPRAIFLGSPALEWHGVDILVGLARSLPDVHFDVVGPAAAGAPENVHVHGVLPEAAYFELLARADVAIGSLALDRAGLTEACPIKVREYLLAGLPTVIGYRDTDFLGRKPWFLLQSVDADAVRAFVDRARGRRVDRSEVAHLFVEAKERERLAFLGSLTAS